MSLAPSSREDLDHIMKHYKLATILFEMAELTEDSNEQVVLMHFARIVMLIPAA